MDKVVSIKNLTIEFNRNKLNILQREGELSEAGELAYSEIPELENKLKMLESKKEQKILRKYVSPDEIAEVISKSTGVPVERMLEGEKEKIINMENELQKKVIGQSEAIQKISRCVLRARAGIQDPNRPIGILSLIHI